MTPEEEIVELKAIVEMYKTSSEEAWKIAGELVKKLLVAEKKYLPQFVQ
jgi:hypothetical protein